MTRRTAALDARRSNPNLGQRDAMARKAAAQPDVISFAGGLPDPELFPTRALGHALQAALHVDAAEALQYGWPEAGLRSIKRRCSLPASRRE